MADQRSLDISNKSRYCTCVHKWEYEQYMPGGHKPQE
jgi:hypothetical protein